MNFRVGILYETWEELQEGTKEYMIMIDYIHA